MKLLEIPENMLACWMGLNNKKPFVSIAENGQRFYWNEYFWRFQNVCAEYHADYFIIVDMDGDGAASIFYHRLTELNKDGYKEGMIAVMDGGYYEVEGEEAAYEGFGDYVEPIESVVLADCMEFTESVLDQKPLGNLTDQEIALVKQIPKENMLEDEPDYQEHKRAPLKRMAVR